MVLLSQDTRFRNGGSLNAILYFTIHSRILGKAHVIVRGISTRMSNTTWRMNEYNLRPDQILRTPVCTTKRHIQVKYHCWQCILILVENYMFQKHEFYVEIRIYPSRIQDQWGLNRDQTQRHPSNLLSLGNHETRIYDLPAIKGTSLKLVNSVGILRIPFQMCIPEVSEAERDQVDYQKEENLAHSGTASDNHT